MVLTARRQHDWSDNKLPMSAIICKFTPMKIVVMSLLSLLGLAGCKGYADLKVDEFEKMLSEDKTVQLVDVRTADEFTAGHIAGAVNIDWYANDFMDQIASKLAKDRPVMVYCRSGKRSAAAAAKLDGAFYKTYNLLGGYLAWTEAGKPVVTQGEPSSDQRYNSAETPEGVNKFIRE